MSLKAYCPDIEMLVTIHTNTIRALRGWHDRARAASGAGYQDAHPL
jgi:hypothetical protein